MLAYRHHFRCHDTCSTIEGGKGLVKFGHVAANGRFAFHKIHLVSGISGSKGRLHARNAASDHQERTFPPSLPAVEGRMMGNPGHGRGNKILCLCRGLGTIRCYPGGLFPDIGHLEISAG